MLALAQHVVFALPQKVEAELHVFNLLTVPKKLQLKEYSTEDIVKEWLWKCTGASTWITAKVLFLFNEAQQNPLIVEVSPVLLRVQEVLIDAGAALFCKSLCFDAAWLPPIIDGVFRKVLYRVEVLKKSNSPLGMSIGLCFMPVAQVPGQS